VAPERSFVFGRADADGVVGLDHNDMGISAEAGSVECGKELWWVVNRSRKRHLLLDGGAGSPLQRLEAGRRHAITVARLGVLVPGVIYTHRLEVVVSVEDLACFNSDNPSSGTITGEVRLSGHDRDVVTALLWGYLQEFPRRQARPRTYQQAADLLGPPWTKTTVRKQIERLRQRLARAGVYCEGPQANFELADHLLENGVVTPVDLDRLAARP
jgi:hypothetical protein